jgi:hypothetical protein
MGWMRGTGLVLLGAMVASAQTAHAPKEAPAIPMPADRAADSYQIYSLLMPGYEFQDSKASEWAIADTTRVMDQLGLMTPDKNIHAPKGQEQVFHELLDDFTAHQHERLHLTGDGFHLSKLVVLLNWEETQLYGSNILGLFVLGQKTSPEEETMRRKVAGAPGLNSFSEVYFSRDHTIAMVFTSQQCGPTCGASYWVVLERKDGQWQDLHWPVPAMMN